MSWTRTFVSAISYTELWFWTRHVFSHKNANILKSSQHFQNRVVCLNSWRKLMSWARKKLDAYELHMFIASWIHIITKTQKHISHFQVSTMTSTWCSTDIVSRVKHLLCLEFNTLAFWSLSFVVPCRGSHF